MPVKSCTINWCLRFCHVNHHAMHVQVSFCLLTCLIIVSCLYGFLTSDARHFLLLLQSRSTAWFLIKRSALEIKARASVMARVWPDRRSYCISIVMCVRDKDVLIKYFKFSTSQWCQHQSLYSDVLKLKLAATQILWSAPTSSWLLPSTSTCY